MARQRRAKTRGTNKTDTEQGARGEYKKQATYDIIIKENAHFEKYYKQLNLMPETEWCEFLECLKQPLPITFRITSYKSYAQETLKILKEKHFKYIDEVTKDTLTKDQVIEASANKGASLIINKLKHESTQESQIYKCLPWYPNELAWQVNLSRQDVRKNIHFDEFKQFLINQTENGNLNRQEAVSMIPPLCLDVKPNHKILDMCSAPGSKTAQLIEFLHSDKTNPTPEGFVIANDLDNKRCYMLMHQLKRLESPNFMIINQDSSSLPNFRVDLDENASKSIMYDRILADVPCSGDGTFRKNIDVWTKWNFAHACNLHGIQSRIARRAAELLQPGGIMVYSTCSLNPVENEAVVYNLLLKFKDLELVDARDKLPGLKTVSGLLKWNLMAKNGDIFETAEEVEKTEFKNLIRPYMFPPEESVARELNLERCIRVLPHHQDTGGFFIAAIRKLEVEVVEVAEPDTSRAMKAPAAKRLKHVFEENPFKFMDSSSQLMADWPSVKEFFGVKDEFPIEQLLTRNKKDENVKNVYFVSKEIRDLTISNGDRFKFINMGVPIFTRAEIKGQSNVELRINQEGIDIITKYFTKRLVRIRERSDLVKVLSESMPTITELSEGMQEQIAEQCKSQQGSFILTTRVDEASVDNGVCISFIAWLGKSTIRPLINVQTRNFFMTILGVEKSTIVDACNRIKQEDKMNSEKSLLTNPVYQAKLNERKNAQEKAEVGDVEENNEEMNE